MTRVQMPGVQPFKCLGDPNTVAQNWVEEIKSFEYFLSASGIRNDARQNAMLLHMVAQRHEKYLRHLYQKMRLMKRHSKH